MSARTDTASRLIPATSDAIYAALIDPDALMSWLPPDGMSGRTLLFEPWQGGRYRIELTHDADGAGKTTTRADISAGRFLLLEPGRRLVQSVEFESDDPAFAGQMIMTWSLDPAPGGTNITITAENVPAGISADDHAVGLASSLANLDRHLRA